MNGSGDDGKDSTLKSKRWKYEERLQHIIDYVYVLKVFNEVSQTITMNSSMTMSTNGTLDRHIMFNKEHWHMNEFANFLQSQKLIEIFTLKNQIKSILQSRISFCLPTFYSLQS